MYTYYIAWIQLEGLSGGEADAELRAKISSLRSETERVPEPAATRMTQVSDKILLIAKYFFHVAYTYLNKVSPSELTTIWSQS